jgi:DNA-binding transcriptional ArsR family regulator
MNHPYKCLNVLGNELRINIINKLQKKDQTVAELVISLGEEQSKISHSLKQLRECNFVDYKQIGKERFYFLKSEIFKKDKGNLFELIDKHVQKYCTEKNMIKK